MKVIPLQSAARKVSARFLPATLGLLCACAADAQVFSFEFTGTIFGTFDTADYVPDAIQGGQAVTGLITYDTANLTDLFPGDPNNGLYRFTGAALGDFSMTVSLVTPGHTYVFTSVAEPASMNWINLIQVETPADNDHGLTYSVGDPLRDGVPLLATANGSLMSVNLGDPSRTALASDAVPGLVPALTSFENASWNLFGYTTGGVQVWGISANITGITPVPEPGEWAVIIGGLLGVFAVVRRRRSPSAR